MDKGRSLLENLLIEDKKVPSMVDWNKVILDKVSNNPGVFTNSSLAKVLAEEITDSPEEQYIYSQRASSAIALPLRDGKIKKNKEGFYELVDQAEKIANTVLEEYREVS